MSDGRIKSPIDLASSFPGPLPVSSRSSMQLLPWPVTDSPLWTSRADTSVMKWPVAFYCSPMYILFLGGGNRPSLPITLPQPRRW